LFNLNKNQEKSIWLAKAYLFKAYKIILNIIHMQIAY